MTYQSEVIADTPYIYWRLESDVLDSSGNGRNGTGTSVSYTTNPFPMGGGALQLSAATRVASANIQPSLPVTLEFQFTPSAADIAAANRSITSKTGPTFTNVGAPLDVTLVSGKLRIVAGSGNTSGPYSLYDGPTLVAGVNYQFVVYLSGPTADPLLWINGLVVPVTLFSQIGTPGWTDPSAPFIVGLRTDGSGGPTGVVAHAAWYQTLLSWYRNNVHAALAFNRNLVAADSAVGTAAATLQSRNGELGAVWTRHTLYSTNAVISNANRIRSSGAGATVIYTVSGSTVSNDYDVEGDLYLASIGAGNYSGIVGRQSVSVDTEYFVYYDSDAGKITLAKVVAGVLTVLGTPVTAGAALGFVHVKLEMRGTTINVYIGGSSTAAITATDSAVTAGKGGVRLFSTATPSDVIGTHIRNVAVFDPQGVAPGGGGGNGTAKKDAPSIGASGIGVPNQKETRMEELDD